MGDDLGIPATRTPARERAAWRGRVSLGLVNTGDQGVERRPRAASPLRQGRAGPQDRRGSSRQTHAALCHRCLGRPVGYGWPLAEVTKNPFDSLRLVNEGNDPHLGGTLR